MFIVISSSSLFFIKPLFKKYIEIKTTKTNVDAMIGKQGFVVERVSNSEGTGLVNIEGNLWTARNIKNDVLEVNQSIVVTRIEGVKAIVEQQ